MTEQTNLLQFCGKPVEKKKVYKNFVEWFGDADVDREEKLRIALMLSELETLNGVTRAELQACIRFMFSDAYDIVTVEPEKFKIIKGGMEK